MVRVPGRPVPELHVVESDRTGDPFSMAIDGGKGEHAPGIQAGQRGLYI